MGINRQVKLGFGIGCGLLVVASLVLVGGGTYWATNTGRDFKVVIKAEKKLNKEFGVLGSYVPADVGLPAGERVETFIQIRQSLSEYHAGMEIALDEFIGQQEENSGDGFREMINTVRAGSRLAPSYALFWLARNEKLLEYGMGAGEYAYIYSLAYYGYLNHDPGDGVNGLGGLTNSSYMVNVKGNLSDSGQELTATEKARSRTSAMMLGFLKQIEFPTGENLTPDITVWMEEVRREIINLQTDPYRILFQDFSDQTLARIFVEFRVDLENVYVPKVNPLELFFQQEEEDKEEE